MVSKNEWETAYRETIERGRTRLSDLPTPEKLLTWLHGELPEDDTERMRELLAYYPDLATALSENDNSPEDDAPLLSQEQMMIDWQLIIERRCEERKK